MSLMKAFLRARKITVIETLEQKLQKLEGKRMAIIEEQKVIVAKYQELRKLDKESLL